MQEIYTSPRILINKLQDEYILTWIEGFLVDKRTQGLSLGTIEFYRYKLTRFSEFCERQEITRISQITPIELRNYLLMLELTGHNAGGRHAHYRVIRTFLYWYELEAEPENWKNPIKKVKSPKLPIEPITPITLEDFRKLLRTCDIEELTGYRDRAILLTLLDTGARASEFVAMSLDDLNLINGSILIRHGKGRKTRTVFIGKKTRRAVRAYLKGRSDANPALWVTVGGDRLATQGLRALLRRRAERAHIIPHGAHDFRRAFALNMLRGGCDIFSLQRLMGHASISILRRYLAQTDKDTAAAHHKHGFVDKI